MNVVSLLPAAAAYPFLKLALQYIVDPDIGCRKITDFQEADIIKHVFTTVREAMEPKYGPLLADIRSCKNVPAYQFITPSDATTVNVCSGYYKSSKISWANIFHTVRGEPLELFWIGGMCAWTPASMVQHAIQRLNYLFLHAACVMAGLLAVEFKGKPLPVCHTREDFSKLWLRLVTHVVPETYRWLANSLQQILDLLNEALTIS